MTGTNICMRNVRLARFFFMIAWCAFFFCNVLKCLADTEEANADVVEVNLNIAKKQLLNKNLFGFNQASPPLKNISIKDFYSWDLVNNLKTVRMRFPGGTEANFYRWETDHFAPSDLDIYTSQDSVYNRQVFEKFGPNGEQVGFQDYVDWSLKHKVKSSFVLNLNTDPDLSNALNVLKAAENRGVEVQYFELGNELYFSGQGGDKYKNPSSYTNAVAASTNKIRQFFPSAKCGVATWFAIYNGKMPPWDLELANKQNNFDALVVHPYFKADAIPDKYLGSTAFSYTEQGFSELLNTYRAVFPGKEFWITEWNIDNPAANINKTLYGTIFTADFFMTLIRQPDITIANYHALLGNTHCLLEAYYWYKNMQFYAEKNLPYYLWHSVGTIFTSSDSFSEPSIIAAEEPRAVNALAFLDSGKIYLMLTNRSNRPKAIKVTNFPTVVMVNEAITGTNLAYALKEVMYQFSYEKSQGTGQLVVKPYSVNFITLLQGEAPQIRALHKGS